MKHTIYTDETALANAVALIESGNNPKARGDLKAPDGPAIGAFQIHQHAWDEISKFRELRKEEIHPWMKAYDAHIARNYATTFLREIVAKFREHYGAPPSPQLLYACYSLGPQILRKIEFMHGLALGYSPYENYIMVPMPTTPFEAFTSVGFSVTLSKRKLATGQRYQNLILAHHQSLKDTGLPILW